MCMLKTRQFSLQANTSLNRSSFQRDRAIVVHHQVRRESTELSDMFIGHIGAMDTFARGLKAVERITTEGHLASWIKHRYASFDSGIGARIEAGTTSFKQLEEHVLQAGEPKQSSGKQEAFEMLLNRYV